MSHLYAGQPLEVVTGADQAPKAFAWRGEWHQVEHLGNRWRVSDGWWRPEGETWREYCKVTTADGLLCALYRDLDGGGWYLARLYD
jgi:hypothetical protein